MAWWKSTKRQRGWVKAHEAKAMGHYGRRAEDRAVIDEALRDGKPGRPTPRPTLRSPPIESKACEHSPAVRKPVTVTEAARVAASLVRSHRRQHGIVHFGRPGGQTFDHRVRAFLVTRK